MGVSEMMYSTKIVKKNMENDLSSNVGSSIIKNTHTHIYIYTYV